jgi:hypothetical protein
MRIYCCLRWRATSASRVRNGYIFGDWRALAGKRDVGRRRRTCLSENFDPLPTPDGVVGHARCEMPAARQNGQTVLLSFRTSPTGRLGATSCHHWLRVS